ncbi:hypothetical protein [Haliea atlantica]
MFEQNLKVLSDTELNDMKAAIEAELEARDKQRKKEAAAEIRKIAVQAGLAVNVTSKTGKARGRPRRRGDGRPGGSD